MVKLKNKEEVNAESPDAQLERREPRGPKKTANPAGVSARAVIIGLSLALLMCAVMPYNDYFIGATYLSGNFFPIGGVAALVLLTLVINPLLMAIGQRKSVFAPSEIITVWSMIVVVAGIPSSGLMRYLIPHIVAPYYYASAVNGWGATILPHLPKRLLVTDPPAVRTFFEGLPRGQGVPWAAWEQPLIWWGSFVALLFGVFFCLSALVRKQWVENDHLTFPLVKLPIMMAEAPEAGQKFNKLFRSRLLWGTVGVVTVLHTVKGLHLFYPSIPDIPTTSISLADYLTTFPYNSIANTVFYVYPLVIGFSFLLSSDVCFSLWFFYVVFKLQVLIGTINGWDLTGSGSGIVMGPGFAAYQEAGGSAMLAAWLIWSMRGHLHQIFRKTFLGDKSVDDSREPMPYRGALLGLIGCYAGLFVWMVRIADVQPLMATAVLGGSLVIFLTLAWMVAEGGLLFTQQSFAPSQIATALSGPGSMNAQSLLMGTLVEHVGWYDAREFMMPPLLNSQKAAGDSGLWARSLMKVLAVTVFLAVLVSGAASIWLPYTHHGATSLTNTWMYQSAPQIPFTWTSTQLHGLAHPTVGLLSNIVGGALLVAGLFALRGYVSSFSLHPAGFLVAATYPMYAMWFSILLGWAVKAPIMHYGGRRAYQMLLPLFLGLILGDCLNALVWTVVGLITHTGYSLLPG